MYKGLLLLTLSLTLNASYFVAIEDFYVDDAVPYLDDIEDECTALINTSVTSLNNSVTGEVYEVNVAYTPDVAENFTKNNFKQFIDIIEEFIEIIKTEILTLPSNLAPADRIENTYATA